ncbi:MAG: hypothetical protein AB8F78_09130 [Saprospiraceae bacterium]
MKSKMNWDEKKAENWLVWKGEGTPVFEPIPNAAPDFVLGETAYEVTRLQETAIIDDRVIPLNASLEVSRLVHRLVDKYEDHSYEGLTYVVQVKGNYKIRLTKKEILRLKDWFKNNSESLISGLEPSIPSEQFGGLTLSLISTRQNYHNLFATYGLYSGVRSVEPNLFARGVQFSIDSKTELCKPLLSEYSRVCLVLVNHICQFVRLSDIPAATVLARESVFSDVIVIHPSSFHDPIYLCGDCS